MKAALLTLAVSGSQLMTPASQQVPDINVERMCKSSSAAARIMGQRETRSVADCVREENDAKLELLKIWPNTENLIRDRCQGEATALGTRTYLDLLSCLQMADDTKSVSKGRVKSK